ncbi:Putative 1,2-phenylacetyl-CoA epoxidase, subunit D [Nocardioides dokdonensis FR1436]|uniref:Putative 1,2-phenylacetyl-CoA epoxidase, subunit D n=1 Tax=Nocardioides dokdonensis FR1436 TaxID=1300347 RepID=A0A1A9GJ02_9ACTN|nr:1,2-phenylacetyl-CoA epoxidase subunit PaaD [Nocardioides dokdonensis]ANH38056.1 Putative 1,2-phenylacetyl-CoA epoxidase, subunit D [Nocardioides dokdonensis FR1436]
MAATSHAVRPGSLTRADAEAAAGTVVDPEMPMLTLVDLGVLREVTVEEAPAGAAVTVALTPTYSGCPAMATMRDDLVRALTEVGFDEVRVQVRLSPPWTSDWITAAGREALRAHRLSPPGPAGPRPDGPVPLRLTATRRRLVCPRCGAEETELTSEYGPTACTALYRCTVCREPFEHLKEI